MMRTIDSFGVCLFIFFVIAAGCGPSQPSASGPTQDPAYHDPAYHDPAYHAPTGAPGAHPGAPEPYGEAEARPADPYEDAEVDTAEPYAAEPPAPERPPAPPEPDPPARPTRSSESGPSGDMAKILTAHNQLRADHCAPPLGWSKKLAKDAQRWADRLRDNRCAFDHDPDTKYGENLAFFSPAGSGGAARTVTGWYDEVAQYDFANPGFDFATGHFTQIVWRQTRELGCAVARCRNAELWVCRYDPPGNWRGQYRANVLAKGCRE